MKIIFIGCVEIGFKCLKQVLKDSWDVSAIFTLAKKYSKNTSGFVDFSALARKHGIGLYRVKNINDEININRIKKIDPDLIIICGWQQLVCEKILKISGKGTIGFHSSLLPRYRGRAPVNWAIIMGEKKTGVTMFYCDPEADTGDIIAQRSFAICPNDTCQTVYHKSAKAARKLLHLFLPKIDKNIVKRKKNTSIKYRFWPKRRPEDGRINWRRASGDIHNWIRALSHPYPGAFSCCNDKKFYIWKSRIYGKKIKSRYVPGEIIKTAGKNGKKNLLVATGDKPIWISDISHTGRRGKCILTKGQRFVQTR